MRRILKHHKININKMRNQNLTLTNLINYTLLISNH